MDLESVFSFWGFDRDLGFGVLIVGCLKKFMDLLGLLILLYFGIKIFNVGFFNRFLNWLCLRNCFHGNSDSKTSICKCGLMSFFNISTPTMIEKWEVVKETVNSNASDRSDADKQEHCDEEDQVFDVMTLRRLVKIERQRAHDAYIELEKERMASTTAAEEAMALILRLQNQKSVLEMEAQQHQRLCHEKQLHDQEVIQSLRWIVMKHESERSILEDRLRLYKQRLKLYQNYDGENGSEWINGSLSRLDNLDEGLVSSLELGLSPW
ncbi:unnamed protein product [Lactuca saligna]|uniref:GTD-binding domain-containing protein n=1 Tax=Lactuca saligna TaxID=75948 RepID=A0AA36E8D6_LACSI|nr:unnamed protein product [Lactuca saligna]